MFKELTVGHFRRLASSSSTQAMTARAKAFGSRARRGDVDGLVAMGMSGTSEFSVETINGFELRGSDPRLGTVNKWRRALEAAGVQFIDPDENGGPRRAAQGREGEAVMASNQTHADRIARSLKRLGFQLSRKARTFRVIDKAGGLAAGSGPAMTLEEIERWISEHIKSPGTS